MTSSQIQVVTTPTEQAEQRPENPDGGRLDHHRTPHRALVGADHAPERELAAALPQIGQQQVEDAGERDDDDQQLDGGGEGVRLVDLARQIVRRPRPCDWTFSR